MYVALLAGGIASGKSTAAHALEERGALLLDLDVLSRDVTAPGSATCERLAEEFGEDVLDEETGGLRRAVLASRAFGSAEATARLERIVHPAIRELLERRLLEASDRQVCVVEVPLLDRVEDLAERADEVICVVCPLAVRRERAQGRGMVLEDFDARASRQPTDEYLRSHADTVWENDGTCNDLRNMIDLWWSEHELAGWEHA